LLEDATVLSPEARAESDASFSSADAVEEQIAFLEKRVPKFAGR